MPVVQLAAHAKSSTLYGWSYGRTSKFFQLDGLLLFYIIMGLHSVSSAIKIIIYNQLTLRKENVTQPLEKEVLRFYLKVSSNLLFQKETLHSINFSKWKTFLPLHQLFYTNIASFGNKNTSLFFSKGEE